MEFLAVTLDDEPASHHEVDPTDTLDDDLHVEGHAQRTQDEPDQGFRTRLGPRIDEAAENAVPLRKHVEQLVQIVGMKDAAAKCGVEGSERGTRTLASDGACDSVEGLHGGGVRMRAAPKAMPMTADRARWPGGAATGLVKVKVKRGVVEDEDSTSRKL